MAFVAHGFDNRNALRRLYMQVRGRQGYPHYMFRTPTNRTQSTGDYALEEAWKVPASALHETYTRSGGLPSENSLLTPTLEARLKRLYACDQVFSS